MQYSKEQLDCAYNIHELRALLTELGGTPSSMKKEEIIKTILDIQDGVIPVPKTQGRKTKREKYREQVIVDYVEDEYEDIAVHNQNVGEVNVTTMLGSTVKVKGTFEKTDTDHGFLRGDNFKMSSVTDIYVSSSAIRNFHLREGDFVEGYAVISRDNGAPSLRQVEFINGKDVSDQRKRFTDLEPIFPDERLKLEIVGENDLSLRAIDILSPIGKGQRALIVSPPKAGKTTLIKKIASSIAKNYPNVYLMVVLIGERPEEVTDIKRSVCAELIYSTFDEKAKNHIRISKLAIEKAKRQAESGKDVVLLIDSITKLTRAYNETLPSSGKTLTGGIDPVSLQEPKSFFGSARNFDGEGSLTVIATALVDTGSKMDDVIYEEFKGTGNSEIFLSRNLSERRIFPSIDLYRSGTRRDDLLLSNDELDLSYNLRRSLDGTKDAEIEVLKLLSSYKTNEELVKNGGKNL